MERYLKDFEQWGGANFFDSELKWYEWDSDMSALSKKFPDVYFVVTGHGEDQGDIWRGYVHDGHVWTYNAEIVFNDDDIAHEFDSETEGDEYYI